MMAATPAPSNFFASSITPSSEASAQPSRPPCRPWNRCRRRPGREISGGFDDSAGLRHGDGAEDDAGRPARQPGSIWSSVRIRRASCTGFLVAFKMASTAKRCGFRRQGASRSTTCSHSKPWFQGLRLGGPDRVVDGGLLHVAKLQANALASLRSIAGNRIMSGVPAKEIRNQGKAELLALFRMECAPALLSLATKAVTGPP